MGKHDQDRDGQGQPQPDKWENWGGRDDDDKHGRDSGDDQQR